MPFAAVLEEVGAAGRFQLLHVFLNVFPLVFLASHNLQNNFGAASPPHRCRVAALDGAGAAGQRPEPGGDAGPPQGSPWNGEIAGGGAGGAGGAGDNATADWRTVAGQLRAGDGWLGDRGVGGTGGGGDRATRPVDRIRDGPVGGYRATDGADGVKGGGGGSSGDGGGHQQDGRNKPVVDLIPSVTSLTSSFANSFTNSTSSSISSRYSTTSSSTISSTTATFSTASSPETLLLAMLPAMPNGRPSSCFEFVLPQWHLARPGPADATRQQEDVKSREDRESQEDRKQEDTESQERGQKQADKLREEEPEKRGCSHGWVYDHSQFQSTIVTEWDLVCSRAPLKQLAQTMFMAGLLCGAFLLGPLADRLGRKRVLSLSHLLLGSSGLAAAFTTSLGPYAACRFMVGVATTGLMINSLTLCVEWLSTQHRELYSGVSGGTYTAGQMLLAGLAFAIRDWRLLQIVISAPYFLFFLWSWFTPESARWLIQRGHYDAALRELRFVAKVNGRRRHGDRLTVEMLRVAMGGDGSEGGGNAVRKHGAIDLLRQPQLRRRTFLLSVIFFTTSFSYYGVALNLQSFGVDIYLMQLVFGAIDIPAKALALVAMSLCGRRCTQCAALVTAAAALLGLLLVPSDMSTLRACVVVVGKGALSASFTCIVLFASESFPTVVRQNGIGACSVAARIGGLLAPLVIMLGDAMPFLPLVAYGGTSLVASAAPWLLPETLRRPLPDTVEGLQDSSTRARGVPDGLGGRGGGEAEGEHGLALRVRQDLPLGSKPEELADEVVEDEMHGRDSHRPTNSNGDAPLGSLLPSRVP